MDRATRITVVIPTLNEQKNLLSLIKEFSLLRAVEKNVRNNIINFLIVDDTLDNSVKNITNRVAWMKYRQGNLNYGDSLTTGMIMSSWNLVKPDKVIIMDADHPPEYISNIIDILNDCDVVVGNEEEITRERRVTRLLCNGILGLNLPHPTCGYIGFNSEILGFELSKKNIRFWCANSKWDMVHVEYLLMCRNKKLKIEHFDFTGQKGERSYTWKRSAIWFKDFIVTIFYQLVGGYG